MKKMMSDVFLSFPGRESSFKLANNQTPGCFIELTSKEELVASEFSHCNSLIRADNLLALKTMEVMGCEFDLIYIDPPYNSTTKFTFNDNHRSQDGWLTMMFARLLLARQILTQQGIFFISIDDREVASLTLLLREVFGQENHIGTLKWRKKRKPSFLDKHFSSVIEYILIFAKDKNKLPKLKGPPIEEKTRPVLNASNALVLRTLPLGTKAFCKDGVYKAGVYTNRTLHFELLDQLIIQNGTVLKEVAVRGPFRVKQDILDKTLFITKKFGLRRMVLPSELGFKHATDDATVNFETNEDGERQLKEFFEAEKVFEFPKPVGVLKNLIKMYTSPKNNITCLDFFAGTATLAQAVHELNRENLGHTYSFCCVQNEEDILEKSQFKTIADIAQARIQRFEDKYHIFPKCKIYSPK